jgi:GNAT superfamily N-acetyltransferase
MTSGKPLKLTVRAATAELWPAFEDLFGSTGACNGCWCMYWRLGRAYWLRDRRANKRDIRSIIERGPAPGLLAFEGDLAVGWAQLGPREQLPWLERNRRFAQPLAQPLAQSLAQPGNTPLWCLSCFFVRRRYRMRGVSAALIAAALRYAKSGGAGVLEAYPVDVEQPAATQNRFTGIASAFERAGFRAIARPSPSRPVMRHDLKGVRRLRSDKPL